MPHPPDAQPPILSSQSGAERAVRPPGAAQRVTIVGAGYVGLNTGAVLAYLGHAVTLVDRDAGRVAELRAGHSPIYEHGLTEMLARTQAVTTYSVDLVGAVGEADLIVIAVGTPARANGEAETAFVEAAAAEIALGLRGGREYVVVVKSTVPIGTSRRVEAVIARGLRQRGVEARVRYASNPEFLREGRALHDTLYPDRIVVGSEDPQAVECLRELYRPLLDQTFEPPPLLPRPRGFTPPPLMVTDPTSAEMIKYAANAYLATKISFINEMAGLCQRVGADVDEVARGMGLDARIGPQFLQAGIGWGGSCFPKDMRALQAVAAEYDYSLPIVQAACAVNTRQREHVLERLQEVLKVLRGRHVAVLGLSFKPHTNDVRDSPGLDIVTRLVQRGAYVRAHDPVALDQARAAHPELDVEWYESLDGVDALVLATPWPEYLELDWAEVARRMRQPVVMDGRNALPAAALRAAGLLHIGVGR
ncbi:UDP-glucose dehydrogenase family protein [Deinococcus aestuarii]|uniref:UDP-glucose dehydrogenase family protein n=1 Tax=Deinococcus aestuarii TaxID=2774531 RepID=UPI001C0DE7F7|nr:UDP-glucose/GDP-mannose dehydrogenase family protein [Deinococcus aestuarii]